jgi:hypothetical protein
MSSRYFGLGVLAIGLAGLGYELNKTRLALATRKWTKVPCTIAKLETVSQNSPLSEDETFAVVGQYSYQVNGADFHSETISNRHCEFLSPAEVKKLTAGLPDTGPHFAYYNPDKPQQAVLVAGNDVTNIKELGTFVLVTGLALFLILKQQ